jgi:hypothetical protein
MSNADAAAAYPRDLRVWSSVPHARCPAVRASRCSSAQLRRGRRDNVLRDPSSETFLSADHAQAYENRMTMESMYEYGSRAGV